MLGWDVIVRRATIGDEAAEIARWRAPVSGLRWADDLISAGVASGGGDGYPMSYRVRAGDVRRAFEDLPHTLGQRFEDTVEVNDEALRACDECEWLQVEAWDLS